MIEKISKKQLRDFGILIGLGFPLFIGCFIPFISGHSFRIWTLYFGMPFIILAIVRPFYLFWPYKLWMKIGEYLGWINSRLILGLVFILILLPISFFMKCFGYDPLRNKYNNKSSYKEIIKERKINLEKIF